MLHHLQSESNTKKQTQIGGKIKKAVNLILRGQKFIVQKKKKKKKKKELGEARYKLTLTILSQGEDEIECSKKIIKCPPYLSSPSLAWLTTEILESWPTHASLLPEGEKETSCTQPPEPLENSAMQFPKVIFFPHGVVEGFSSISFT